MLLAKELRGQRKQFSFLDPHFPTPSAALFIFSGNIVIYIWPRCSCCCFRWPAGGKVI